MSSLVWFRSDLRASDNGALSAACARGGPVAGVFLAAEAEWQGHGWGARRQRFVWEHALALRAELAARGIPLHILHVPRFAGAAGALSELARQAGAGQVLAQAEHGVDELARDRATHTALARDVVQLELLDGFTLLRPGSVLTREGTPFRVFTPFRRSWIEQARAGSLACHAAPRAGDAIAPPPLPGWRPLHASIDLQRWPIGEHAAQRRLDRFVDERIHRYDVERDIPALDATSRLSPYLACGALSARQCFAAALRRNHGEWDSGNAGIRGWLTELVWREFYTHVLRAFPRVSRNRAFRPEAERIAWNEPGDALARWQQGQTGFPLLDAGMRQLLAEGWMHNRLRMLSAMFLSKYLLIDWRHGERHFMEQLLDGELAANNGGWQWSASTGTDAAPYFRTLCPVRQAQRFDTTGDYVRRHVPELALCTTRALLRPGDPRLLATAYPSPMIDLRMARRRALETFARALQSRPEHATCTANC